LGDGSGGCVPSCLSVGARGPLRHPAVFSVPGQGRVLVMRRRFVETGRDRRDLAAEAGYGRLSLSSVLAGVLVGAGTFGLLAVSAIAVAHRVGWDGELMDTPRGELALGGGLVMAGLLLVSFLYGGYVSGRMARRAGLTHGVATFVLAVGGTIAAVAIVTS